MMFVGCSVCYVYCDCLHHFIWFLWLF